jgi:6-methylsalicylate decarboxylase
MLSVSSPGVHMNTTTSVELARSVNEEGAALVQRHPDRFGLLASLPLPHLEAAIQEADHALHTLGADGICLLTNYDGTYLGDPSLEPLWARLNDHQAVVLLHPTSPACSEATALSRPRPMIEFLFDTTRTVTQLALNGVFGRHPDISFIVPHAGAAFPVLADRIACFALAEPTDDPVDVLHALRALYYDVAGFALPRALPALLRLTDPDRLLYGSDYPFTADWIAEGLARSLVDSDVLDAAARQRMLSGNAPVLFPRLSKSAPAMSGPW